MNEHYVLKWAGAEDNMNRWKQQHRLAVAACFAAGVVSTAITRVDGATWSAGDNSGQWTDGANWSQGTGTGGMPGSADTVELGNVTSGTRTVTVSGTPDITRNAILTQTTEGAVNRLYIEANTVLTLTNGGTAFGNSINSSAGISSVVIDVAGAITLTTQNSAAPLTISNTLTFSSGASVGYSALSNPTISIIGVTSINAGAGGSAMIGTAGAGSNVTLALNIATGGALNVASGTLNVMSTAVNGGPSLQLANAGSTTIASNATLALLGPTGTGNKSVSVSNSGLMTHAGTLAVRPSGGGGAPGTIANTGTWVVSGSEALIEQQVGAGNVPIVSFTNSGTLTGSGRLTFSNLESAAQIPVTNAGTISPGANGVGSLTIAGSNLAFGPTSGTLRIDASSETDHDSLVLTGSLSLIGTGDTLNLVLAEGFSPVNGVFTLEDVLTYSSLTGSFETFLVNGQASPWTVEFINKGTSGDLVVTVPEPGAMTLLLPALLCLRRRRTRN